MNCTHAKQCGLFVQFAAEPTIALWVKRYCNKNYHQCARYQCAIKQQPVPTTLLPNGAQLGAAQDRRDITLTAIFNAISKNRCNMVKSLFKSNPGAQNTVNSDGISALMFAAKLGNYVMIKLLLEHGCDPTLKNHKGKTALDIALQHNHQVCADTLRTAEHKIMIYSAAANHAQPAMETSNKQSVLSRMLDLIRGHKHVATTEQNF